MGHEDISVGRNALGKLDPANKNSVFSDGGPMRTFGWQLAKAVIAALVVVIYSRGMGAHGRGALSILLLNLQLVLMVSELVAGGALANLLTKYSVRRILPTAWFFLVLILFVAYVVGWFFWVIPNASDYPICLDHPKVITLNLLFFQGLFLGGLNIQYNLYQAHGWVHRRNKLQVFMEILKLLGLLLCFEAMYGLIIPKHAAIELSVSLHTAERLMDGQTLDYLRGFDEMAILWVLVYASGAVWVYSLWQSRLLFKGGPMHFIYLSTEDMGKAQIESNNGSFWRSIQPPKEMFHSGVLSQLGHILLFLLYRLPLWWMAAQFGNSQAGLLANALLIADTIWILGNSFGTILHSRMLVMGVNSPRFDRLLSRYIVLSGLGTFTAIVFSMLLPNSLYVGVFGDTFQTLKETFLMISPAVLFLGISAPIGHYLHAKNRFKSLIVSYFSALIVLILCWKGLGVFVSLDAVENQNFGLSGTLRYIRDHLGKMLSIDMAFFVLFLLNYLQVKHIVNTRGILLVVWRFARKQFARKWGLLV